MISGRCTLLISIAAVFSTLTGCSNREAQIKLAQAQVQRLAEELDSQTSETGVYIRAEDNAVKETDPWGTLLKVTYAQGGVAEVLSVRSAGPDKEFHTADDIVAGGFSANLKGIGEGIKKNVEGTAAGAAKGLVKGAVSGVKESIKEALPRKNDKPLAE